MSTQELGATASQSVELPDGSGVAFGKFPLPREHWLYDANEYPGPDPIPMLATQTLSIEHARDLREQIQVRLRHAIRGATLCGNDMDFDPDALVQNAVAALMGSQAELKRTR